MKKLITITFVTLLFVGCADAQPEVVNCVTGHEYGFWGGLWHGIIAPISFIVSLFNDDVAVFAVNNNGGWYTFGFVLGIGGLTGGSSRASK